MGFLKEKPNGGESYLGGEKPNILVFKIIGWRGTFKRSLDLGEDLVVTKNHAFKISGQLVKGIIKRLPNGG